MNFSPPYRVSRASNFQPIRFLLVVATSLTLMSACSATSRQEKLSSFSEEVTTLINEGNVEGLLRLYHWTSSTPQMSIDVKSQAWKDGFHTGGLKEVEVVPIGSHRFDELALQGEFQGKEINGKIYRPNLAVVGALVVRFEPKGRPSWTFTEPIGENDSGSLALAGVEVVKK